MLSVTFRYALISLLDIASQDGLQASVIAERHHLSSQTLATVISELRRLGFVISQKGRNGGYQLARSPETISLLELQMCITGPRQQQHSSQVEDWIQALEDRWLNELASHTLSGLPKSVITAWRLLSSRLPAPAFP